MVFRPDCEGGVATNRSSAPTFYMSPMLLFVLRIVFCFTTVCRVPDVRMTRARDSVLAGLHATRDLGGVLTGVHGNTAGERGDAQENFAGLQ